MGKTENFVNKAKKIHGDRYDYSKVNFINNRTKVVINCPLHGDFTQTPKNHLRGQGCPKCGKEYARTCHSGDYTSFVNEVKSRFGDRYSFPNIEVEYENSHSKVTVKCNLCGNIYKKIACDVLTSKTGGCWCKENKDKYIDFETLQNKIDMFQISYFTGDKKISTDKVVVTCRKCGSVREAKIKSLLNGKCGCKKCMGIKSGNLKRIPTENALSNLAEKYPTIKFDENTYINTTKNIRCYCKKCGHEFYRSYNSFMNPKANTEEPCPKCNKEKISQERTKTNDKFIEDMNNLYGVGKYELLGDYTKSREKVSIKCNDCGRTFTIEANSFLQGHGCPYHNCNSSTKEKEIAEYIKDITNCDIHTNDRTVLDGKELDIYVPERKIAIEFDGIFWHNENNKANNYHLEKTEDCEKNGIRLIHIFEDEWLKKKDIWKSMLNNIFETTPNKIFARKCVIKEVGVKDCTDFLNVNHLQGWCPSQIKLGLYYGDELVSVMTFGKSRHFIGNGEVEYELLRYCNKTFTNVVGGASKLFSHFIKKYHPNSIVSYADRRWSQGGLYDILGFEFVHDSKPNYYYVIDGVRKNRFNYRKRILVEKYNCPQDMSEREFCQQQKWYRIYDCGTKVYKWFKE